jgi:hypothetical protein
MREVTAALYLVIPLVLLGLLLLRRYPGERQLLALRSRRRARRRPQTESAPLRPARPGWLPRGGLLIACSLAVRPPPAPSLATR